MSAIVGIEKDYEPTIRINYADGDFQPQIISEDESYTYYSIKDGYSNWLDTSAGITRVKLDAVEAIIIEDRTEADDPYTVSIHTSFSCYTVRFNHAHEAANWGVWFANQVATYQSN